MFKMKKESSKGTYYYRIRGNMAQDYHGVPYVKTEDIDSMSDIIDDFLSKNYVQTITRNQPAFSKTLNKDMVLIRSYDIVLELDTSIYDKYRDKIELNLSRNTYDAVRNFSVNNGTKILVNYVTSGCDYEMTHFSNQALYDVSEISGIKTLYISYDNALDRELFKNIVFDFYGDCSVEPEVTFLPGVEVSLKLDNKLLTLDWRAYELATSLVGDLKDKSSVKKLQMRMED